MMEDGVAVMSGDIKQAGIAAGRAGGSRANLHNNVGVTKLMQQCTSMLREKMWNDTHARPPPPAMRYRAAENGSGKPDNALEAMGPVLESVLGSLTQEYERRLMLKDQEIKQAKEQLQRAQEQAAAFEQQLASGGQRAQIEYQMTEEMKAEIENMRNQELALQNQVEQKSQEHDLIINEFERVKQHNMRLEITCKDYQEKLLASEAIMANYKAIQEENRRLYNQVQDLRGNIRVFCRVRPVGATGDNSHSCIQIGDSGQVAIYHPENGRRFVYAFDKVFEQSVTQEHVYIETQPLIRSVVDGYNVCIFAYGQTGSGKTHTMSGTNVDKLSGRGINYRALDDLFDLQHSRRSEVKYDIRVQMLEVYNEKVRDLLVEKGQSNRNLEVQNTRNSGTNVPDAQQIEVSNTQDVLDVMERGQTNRATADTKMNERSSRSHSVLTVIVDGFNTVTEMTTHGCLHLVDLAGSERVGRSEAAGERLEEAKHINKSLSAIGDVMSALASKAKHVPFRNSKLTQLLADSLSGQAKVMMFLHVAPETTSHSETVSTLKFGSRVSEITLGQAAKNVERGSPLEIREAQKEMQSKVSMLSDEVKRKTQQAALQQDEAAQARANEAAALKKAALLEQQVADLQSRMASKQLNSDHSTTSIGSGSKRTPRMSASNRQGSSTAHSSGSNHSNGGGGGGNSMTAEEKHIQRMRLVMSKREAASGLPQRPRTALGATSMNSPPSTAGSSGGGAGGGPVPASRIKSSRKASRT